LLNIDLNSSKFFSFIENNVVKYYLTNCKTDSQIEKHNWTQIRKRFISAGRAGSGKGGCRSGSAKKLTASASLTDRKHISFEDSEQHFTIDCLNNLIFLCAFKI
jgi:hypothetical protein